MEMQNNKGVYGDTIGVVEPGLTLFFKIKESEWKELKYVKNESILYQLGTSFIAFSFSTTFTMLASQTINPIIEKVFCVVIGFTFGIGVLLVYLWYREHLRKNNVINKVEARAKEQFGNNIDI